MTKRLKVAIGILLENRIFELKEKIEELEFWSNTDYSKKQLQINKRKIKEAELNLNEFKTLIDD
jgi:hypothetical protein